MPIKADGSYEIDMVPPGTYVLRVEDAADVNDPANAYDMQDKNLKVTKEYDADEYEVMVVDKDVVMEDVLLEAVKDKQ